MDIPFHIPYIDDDDINAVVEAVKSGWTTMGPKTLEFEQMFARFCNIAHALAVSSCTAALHLALKVCGVDKNDEVIIPANTFVATAEVVEYCGAKVLMADIDRDTHCISVESISQLLSHKTKAVIPVHYAGHPCDMDALMDIASNHNLYVIEDAAHSLPSYYKNKFIGSIGNIGCFSFYATKTLPTGEGGMMVTQNGEWAKEASSLRLHGMDKDAWKRYDYDGSWMYDVVYQGYKYNMTDIAAAMGITQLKKIEYTNNRRKYIAQKYSEAFADIDTLIPYVEKDGCTSCWHLYPLKLCVEKLSITRDDFINKLLQRGIKTSVHFIPLYRFSYFKANYLNAVTQCRNTEWVYEREISLPIYPSMTDEEINYVIDNVLDIATRFKR